MLHRYKTDRLKSFSCLHTHSVSCVNKQIESPISIGISVSDRSCVCVCLHVRGTNAQT